MHVPFASCHHPSRPLGLVPLLAWSVVVGACGGGGGGVSDSTGPVASPPAAATVSIDTTVFASAVADPTKTMVVESDVDGPSMVLSAAASVQVCVSGTWTQQLKGGGTVSLFTTSLAPAVLPQRASTAVDAFGPETLIPLAFSQCDTHALPAGTHALRHRLRVECPAACLSGYSLSLRWRAQTAG